MTDDVHILLPTLRRHAISIHDRVNAFKHVVGGLHQTGRGDVWDPEIMVAVSSLIYNKYLLNVMLDDTESKWKEKPPPT